MAADSYACLPLDGAVQRTAEVALKAGVWGVSALGVKDIGWGTVTVKGRS